VGTDSVPEKSLLLQSAVVYGHKKQCTCCQILTLILLSAEAQNML